MGKTGDTKRGELGAFLRSRRARLQPRDVGLPVTGRRQTPGLRRQEVAELAGISIDYYIRLEQGRGPRPSRQILSALARALLLTRDEREYLFRMAGESPPAIVGPSREVAPTVRHLLDALAKTPAYVLDAKYEILAWNQLATHFIGDLSMVEESNRNMIRWIFTRPDSDQHWTDDQARCFARAVVSDLRAAYARYPGDRGIADLVTELLGISRTFAGMWHAQDVEVRRAVVKRMDHPLVGPIEIECQLLHIPDTDQRLIVYIAEPGSPSHAALERLTEYSYTATA